MQCTNLKYSRNNSHQNGPGYTDWPDQMRGEGALPRTLLPALGAWRPQPLQGEVWYFPSRNENICLQNTCMRNPPQVIHDSGKVPSPGSPRQDGAHQLEGCSGASSSNPEPSGRQASKGGRLPWLCAAGLHSYRVLGHTKLVHAGKTEEQLAGRRGADWEVPQRHFLECRECSVPGRDLDRRGFCICWTLLIEYLRSVRFTVRRLTQK